MAGDAKNGRVILALDQGTTSSRAIVFAADGGVLSLAQREIGLHFPQPGWVEQDALEIWTAQRETAVEALQKCGVAIGDVAGIGITNQRETTIVWDRATSLPIAPAIVWQDRRTAERCEELRRAGHEALVKRKTGLVLDPYFSATKIRWLLDSVSGARERAERGELAFGTVDCWLAWKLSGNRLHVTDATNASRTLLYDLRAGDWDDELLELFGVPRALLPTVCDTSGVVGQTAGEVFGEPLPLAAMVGDQQAALFGQACIARGMTKVTYGTGCFLLMNTGEEPVASQSGLLSTVALQRGGRRTYALEGSVFIGGAAIQWLRDGLGIIAEARDSEALAARVPASDGVYFVPALAGLGAPYWEPRARGAILGLTRGTTSAHIARATLEGIAFQVADLLGAVAADAGVAPAHVRADGGASHNDLLLQFQADILGEPVTRAAQTESTALGAALLAGLAVGLWSDEAETAALWRAARTFVPDPNADRAALLAGWRAAVDCVRDLAGRAHEASASRAACRLTEERMKPKPTAKAEEQATELALRQSNARYDELVRRIPVGIYTMRMQADGAARFEYASERFCHMLGLDLQDVLRAAESVHGRIHPDDRASLDEASRRAAQTLAPLRWEGRFHVRGAARWLRIESEPTVLPDGDSMWNGVIIDVTARRQAEEALRASEDQFRSVFQNAPLGISHSAWNGRMLEANPALAKLLGYSSPDELVAAASDMTTQLYVDPGVRPRIMDDLQQADGWVHYDGVSWRRKDGRIITVDMTGRKVLDENGSFVYLEGFFQDITERQDAEGALKRLADRDPLTGILNQRAFHAAATQRIAALGGAHAALVFMDLDGLKEINDRYGHATGDRALATFAQMLGDAFRESDIVGRVGGDEFAVLAVSREVVSDEALLARLRAELRQVGVSGELPCEIAASSGVAWWDASMGTADFPELVGVADARMYETKRAKKAAAEPHPD